MNQKRYKSFEEIDRELAILKIEKEISYQKIILGWDKILEIFSPKTLSKNIVNTFLNLFSASHFSILKFSLPLIFKWFSNKKRS